MLRWLRSLFRRRLLRRRCAELSQEMWTYTYEEHHMCPSCNCEWTLERVVRPSRRLGSYPRHFFTICDRCWAERREVESDG